MLFQVVHTEVNSLKCVVSERKNCEGQDTKRKVVECRVVILEHILVAVAFKVVLET